MQRNYCVGRVGYGLKLKVKEDHFEEGKAFYYARISVYTDAYNKHNDEREDIRLDFVIMGKKAKAAAEHLSKGDLVGVDYYVIPKTEIMDDKKIYTYELKLLDIKFLSVQKWKQPKDDEN